MNTKIQCSNKINEVLCPFPQGTRWTKQYKKQKNLSPKLTMPEHYGPTRLAARTLAEREQAILLSQGKSVKEVLEATENMLKALANTQSCKTEAILPSVEAKELKKDLDEQRASGTIAATPIRRLITTTTTTIEFNDHEISPPAYN